MERVDNYAIQAAQAKERFLTYDQQKLIDKLKLRHDETIHATTPQRLHDCLGQAVMMAINETWTASKKARETKRKAYYFSAEYLMGRLVYSNLFSLLFAMVIVQVGRSVSWLFVEFKK